MTAEQAEVIDLAAIHPGEVPARCWDSLTRIKGWSVFVRPDGAPDDEGAA